MSKGKNFFYRINPNEVLAELVFVENREAWLLQFFNDLRNDDPEAAKIPMASRIIQEAHSFRNKRSVAGRASAERRVNKEQQQLTKVDHMLFNVQPVAVTESESIAETKEKRKNIRGESKRFIPPTLEEIQAYCHERGNNVNPQAWHDYYKSNGWMVGKNKMKDWQAAVRTWERGGNGRQKRSSRGAGTFTAFAEANGPNVDWLGTES